MTSWPPHSPVPTLPTLPTILIRSDLPPPGPGYPAWIRHPGTLTHHPHFPHFPHFPHSADLICPRLDPATLPGYNVLAPPANNGTYDFTANASKPESFMLCSVANHCTSVGVGRCVCGGLVVWRGVVKCGYVWGNAHLVAYAVPTSQSLIASRSAQLPTTAPWWV